MFKEVLSYQRHNAVGRPLILREMRNCGYNDCDNTFVVVITSVRKFCSRKCANKSNGRKGKTYIEIYGDRAEEVAEKIAKSNTGKKPSKETKTKQRNAKLGTKQSEGHIRKRLEARKNNGKPWHSKETADKMSKTRFELWKDPEFIRNHIGENAPNWLGGLSFIDYPAEFNEKLKNLIKERDNYTCQLCRRKEDLCIHHIDYIKENLDPRNLVTLCRSCNSVVNFNRRKWTELFGSQIGILKADQIKSIMVV